MGNFQLKIDVEPEDIPSLDDSHKQDCADAINRMINSTFKFTMIFAFAVIGVFAVYTLFGLVYVLRMGTALPNLSPFLPLIAFIIIIFELIAGTMKRWALALELILHVALAVFSLTKIQSAAAIPFAAYGLYLHFKLLTLVPHYEVISSLKGFPDFTPLPIGDVVKKADTENDVREKQEDVPDSTGSTDSGEKEKLPESGSVPEKEVKNEGTAVSEKEEKQQSGEPSSLAEEKKAPEQEKEVPEEEQAFHKEEQEAPKEEKASGEGENKTLPEEKQAPAKEGNSQPRKSNNSSHNSRKKKKRKKSSK